MPTRASATESEAGEWVVGGWFVPRPSRPLHSTRCVATARSTGRRCRRWSVIGFERCAKHGGFGQLENLKEYRERILGDARLQLLAATGDAVETLIRIRDDEDAPKAVRLKAAAEILDRAGIHKGTELTITAAAQPEICPAEIIRGRLERLAAAAQAERLELGSSEPEAEDQAARTD